jgi:hypothetical protein
MGYQPRRQTSRRNIHEYKKSFREKSKAKKHAQKRAATTLLTENQLTTEQTISEATLIRLHTLGKQKFGSSPFSEHFDRWIVNVTNVIAEFESYPSIEIDEQFALERSQVLSTIKQQLEYRRQKEGTLDLELKALSDYKNRLNEFNAEYLMNAKAIKTQRNQQTKQFNTDVEQLKKEQDTIIKMKTGFFRGISQKEREQKEAHITEQITHKQNQLETLLVDYSSQLRDLRATYESKRAPVIWQIKCLKENIVSLETDGSLEERWLACEALADAVAAFMLRKAKSAKT